MVELKPCPLCGGKARLFVSECLACPDFVDKAQDDLETFYGRADNG